MCHFEYFHWLSISRYLFCMVYTTGLGTGKLRGMNFFRENANRKLTLNISDKQYSAPWLGVLTNLHKYNKKNKILLTPSQFSLEQVHTFKNSDQKWEINSPVMPWIFGMYTGTAYIILILSSFQCVDLAIKNGLRMFIFYFWDFQRIPFVYARSPPILSENVNKVQSKVYIWI